jgi:hypothetical protein
VFVPIVIFALAVVVVFAERIIPFRPLKPPVPPSMYETNTVSSFIFGNGYEVGVIRMRFVPEAMDMGDTIISIRVGDSQVCEGDIGRYHGAVSGRAWGGTLMGSAVSAAFV